MDNKTYNQVECALQGIARLAESAPNPKEGCIVDLKKIDKTEGCLDQILQYANSALEKMNQAGEE
jgi:hypothetical protein